MASERRKSLVASKDEDILGVVSPSRHGPVARAPPRAVEPKSPKTGRSSKYQTAEEPPQRTGKVPARSRRGSMSDVAEHYAVSPVSSAANTRHKGLAPHKGVNIVHHAKPLPSNTPVSSALRDVSKKHAQMHPRSRRISKSELQSKTPELQDNVQARNVVQGQRGIAAGDPLESKATQPGEKESQQYLTAPAPANAAPESAKYGESLLDDEQVHPSWPCMLFAVALLVTLAFLVILFMDESTESLASMERTTTPSVIVAYATAATQGREIIESAEPDTSVSTSNEHAETAVVTEFAEDEDSDASTALTMQHQADMHEYITSTKGRKKLKRSTSLL